jgi:hypothetical protein
MNERPPLPHVGRKARAAGDVVFGFAAPVKAAALDDQTDVRKTDEWKRFKRSIPSFITLLVRHVG